MIFTVLGWISLIILGITIAPRFVLVFFICNFLAITYELPINNLYILIHIAGYFFAGIIDFIYFYIMWINTESR